MAEVLWTFGVQEVLKKVLKVASEEIGVALGFKKELFKLTKWLLKSEAILRDINTKKLHHDSVRMWVEDLQHLVYEADDLLDELVYEDLRRKVETEKTKKVQSFFSSSHNPFLVRRNMAKRMKDIIEILCIHYYGSSPLGLVAVVGEEYIETHRNIDLKQIRETTSSFDFEEVIIGREIEVSNIVKLVIESSKEHQMSIIPVVGMGGLGKTTLAKMVFNHELVKGHFDETIWVCVAEPFIVMNILEGIFLSLTKTSSSSLNKENLLGRLQEEMQGKNYFLVLDDVWNEEARLWGELRECLKSIAGKSGTSIFVTTRSADVATIMGTTSSHHLKKLCDDQCWSLFKVSASVNGLELEFIREEVVRKIGGVPLVAKVLGGAVKFEGDYKTWVTKFKSVMKNISKDDKDFVSSILKLSVDCLPLPSLKQCFAYCSNFPKDYIFHKKRLIQMWIAQGFIQPQEGDNELMVEDTGEGYFNFLLSRSLFEVVDRDKGEMITYFKMHDLIHDIACAISTHQEVLGNHGEKSVRKLRTLFFDKNIDYKFEDYVTLRVLVLDATYLEPSNSFGMLKHLRYLHIYGNIVNLKVDVESIAMLYNLQTLKLGEEILHRIKKLRKLVNLRHLEFDEVGYEGMPLHISQLIHLQTLSMYRVSDREGRRIEELGPLKNLKGSLRLTNLENVKSKEEAIGAKLMEKKNITELSYSYSYVNSNGEDHNNQSGLEGVLEGLQPHHNLQSLSIYEYCGQVVPNRIFVEGLVMIVLKGCRKCEKIPMFGQLPNLEDLSLWPYKLAIVKIDETAKSVATKLYLEKQYNNSASSTLGYLTTLKILKISRFDGIEAVPEWLEKLVCLEELKLYYCKNLKLLPSKEVMLSLTKLNCLEVKGCLQLRLGQDDPQRAKLSHLPNNCIKDEVL